MAEPAPEGLRESARVEAFSDGVFAIAITLLILEIRLPEIEEGHLGEAILHEWPALVAFITAFLSILVMWINHHNLFTLLRGVKPPFLLLNGLLLLGITFLPFPTHLASEHLATSDAGVAMLVFAATLFYIALGYNALWLYVSRARLLRPSVEAAAAARRTDRRYITGLLMYGLGFAVALWLPFLSLAIILGMAIFFLVAGVRA